MLNIVILLIVKLNWLSYRLLDYKQEMVRGIVLTLLYYIYIYSLYLVVSSLNNMLSLTATYICNYLGLTVVIIISLYIIFLILYVLTICKWRPNVFRVEYYPKGIFQNY